MGNNINFTIEDIENEDKLLLRAMKFAIMAHQGQKRKVGDNVEYINHPINVANLLSKQTKNRKLIAAAYLHDVVEDTKYSIDDIENYFGIEVANYVNQVTESGKELPWEFRKTEMIERFYDASPEVKMLAACDKLSNITDLNEYFQDIKKVDFSSFNRGKNKQEWYYRNVYMSLVHNMDENNFIFRNLRNNINEVFGRSMEEYFEKEKCMKLI